MLIDQRRWRLMSGDGDDHRVDIRALHRLFEGFAMAYGRDVVVVLDFDRAGPPGATWRVLSR